MTTIRTTRAWVEICVSHSRRSIDLWDQKRVRYSCFEKCMSPMIDMFGTFNTCDLRGLLDREYPCTIRSHPYVLPSKNTISITHALYSDNIILTILKHLFSRRNKSRQKLFGIYLLSWVFLLIIIIVFGTYMFFKTVETRYWTNDSFHRGCTVSLQEGATMSEYTVDWAINVSVGVQTFFSSYFALSYSPSKSHEPCGTTRRIADDSLRCSIDASQTNSP